MKNGTGTQIIHQEEDGLQANQISQHYLISHWRDKPGQSREFNRSSRCFLRENRTTMPYI